MAAAQDLFQDSFWLNKSQVEDAEVAYQTYLSAQQFGAVAVKTSSLASEIEKARKQIKQSLTVDSAAPAAASAPVAGGDVMQRIASLERENKELRQVTSDLQAAVKKLEEKMQRLETGAKPAPAAAPAQSAPAAKPAPKPTDDDDDSDDDVDLFGSDDDEETAAEAERLKQERLKQYQEKKAKKPAVIAKSNIILDVKPWDDETDMQEMERCVRSIEMDGLLWGSAKLVEIGYGIKKLQIACVVEDDKVSTDDLEEKITAFEDLVQSMDIAAFNKI